MLRLHDLKPFLEAVAHALGFQALGIARLEKHSPGFLKFQEWIRKRFHGEMHYLERTLEKRENPELILPQAKTILVFSHEDQADSHLSSSSPFISRYAWGEDYHQILGRKLALLQEKLQQAFPEHQFKHYVDTGPIQEKYWASRTRLGWIGKHTNLIHPQRGSYFFLASLLTDLEIEPDAPSANHCGTCTSCITICPTQAIVAPYVLDARLCISYLTIELKGPIPKHLRRKIGSHVFGCDDCQEVCPWNRHSRLPVESLRKASIDELIEWLGLSREQFKERFQGSPILRAKRRGFLRNVCVVLGNLRDPRAIVALGQALNDEEELIRGHAAWALGEMGEAPTLSVLKKRFEQEQESWVRREIDEAIQKVSFVPQEAGPAGPPLPP